MPSPSLTLWIDIATGKLISGWQSISFAPNPVLKQGDSIGVELHLVKNFNGGSFAEYEFSPSTAVTLEIGRIDTAPESGTYKLVYGSSTTSAISATATAAEVQTALNALASITSEGGVTVTKVSNSFRIIWNTAAVTTNTLTSSLNELYPTSSIGVTKTKTGSTSPLQKQIYQVHVKQSPIALVNSFVNQDASTVTVDEIHTPSFTGDVKVWRVSVSPQPRSGSFLIGFNFGSEQYTTESIDVNSSADAVLSALTTAFDATWGVVKSGNNQWDISTSSTSILNLTSSDSGIIGFSSKYGVLNLNTVEVEDFIAGDQSAEGTLEVQIETDGTKTTVIQQPVTILNDLIDDASYTIVQYGSYLPADSVVRFDTAQTLTQSQKTQAKANIGVLDVDTTSLTAKDVELEGRIVDLENVTISPSQLDAITDSQLPSATNVFVTASVLASGISGKANTNHTHLMSEISGLSAELGGKSDTDHPHIVSEISGLASSLSSKANLTTVETLLLGKSDTSHTHTSLSLSSLIVNDGTSSVVINPASTIQAISTPPDPSSVPVGTSYPYEIPIKINGVIWMIPARLYP